MKYIRTKDGIYEIDTLSICYMGETHFSCLDITHTKAFNEWYTIKQADTIEELCDCYIIKDIDEKYPFTTKEIKSLDYANNKDRHNFEIYGAIWVEGEHGESILKTVTKPMNEKGELELL